MSLSSDQAGTAPADAGRTDRDGAGARSETAGAGGTAASGITASGTAASNVIPFVRPRRAGDEAAPSRAPTIAVEVRTLAPPWRRDWRFAAFVLLSLGLHGAVYWALNRPPEPLASVGIEAMDVDIVLGAETPAGQSQQSSETEAQPAPAAPEQAKAAPAEEPPQEKTAEAAKPPELPVAAEDKAPEAPPEQTAQLPEPPPEPQPPEKTESSVPPETPSEPVPPQEPAIAAAPTPEPPAPVAEAPAPPAALAMREPEPEPAPPKPKLVQPKPEPPKQHAPAEAKPKPTRHTERTGPASAKPAHESGQEQTRQAALPSAGSSGIGRGHSDASSNYPGLVAAHLARFKRFPAEARGRGESGVATVRFTLDGGGRVSSVTLVRPSGNAAFDRESQDVVHRASPFPAPPDGQGKSFTIPVRFSLM